MTLAASVAGAMASSSLVRLPWPDGIFLYQPAFWPAAQAERLLAQQLAQIDWHQHSVRLFGRQQPAPRLSCWQGDAGARYRYSGVAHEPCPWTPTVIAVRVQIQAALAGDGTGQTGGDTDARQPARFNSVLANLYRDGADGIGWHSDNEPELGPEPLIASASFGGPRRFRLRHRGRGLTRELVLAPGSLLVMAGASQRYWQHAVPKTARPCRPRLNLTFRWITPP